VFDLDSRRLALVHCVLFASRVDLLVELLLSCRRGDENVSDVVRSSLFNGFYVVKSGSTPQPGSSLVTDKTHTKTSSMTGYENEDGSKGVARV
jgi:hypothetical protein